MAVVNNNLGISSAAAPAISIPAPVLKQPSSAVPLVNPNSAQTVSKASTTKKKTTNNSNSAVGATVNAETQISGNAVGTNELIDQIFRNQAQNQELYVASAEAQRAYNSAEAQLNRDWQERMSNTAYQRAVADLKAAGLNPVLAAMNSGATTPTGGAASSGQNDVDTSGQSALISLMTSLISANSALSVANAYNAGDDRRLAQQLAFYARENQLNRNYGLTNNVLDNLVRIFTNGFANWFKK